MAKSARKQHPMQTIAEEGRTPVTKGETTVQSVVPGLRAKGDALAQTVINEAANQGSSWTRFYKDLLELAPEGRDAFRKAIASATARPKDENGKPTVIVMADEEGNEIENSEPIAKGARSSARVRLSEFVQISKALDVGLRMSGEWAFHVAVGHARTFLRSAGMGSSKGRKALSAADKLKAYIAKNAQEVGGYAKVAAIVQELVAESN